MADGRREPPPPVVAERGRVVRVDARCSRTVCELPPVRELRRPVELDGAGAGRLRDHPDLSAVLQDDGVGQVHVALQDGTGHAHGAVVVELHDGDHAAADAVVEVLDEQIGPTVHHDGERVRVEVLAVVGEVVPPVAGQGAAGQDAGSVREPPPDPPVRTAVERPVDAPGAGGREGAAGPPGRGPHGVANGFIGISRLRGQAESVAGNGGGEQLHRPGEHVVERGGDHGGELAARPPLGEGPLPVVDDAHHREPVGQQRSDGGVLAGLVVERERPVPGAGRSAGQVDPGLGPRPGAGTVPVGGVLPGRGASRQQVGASGAEAVAAAFALEQGIDVVAPGRSLVDRDDLHGVAGRRRAPRRGRRATPARARRGSRISTTIGLTPPRRVRIGPGRGRPAVALDVVSA